MAVLAVAVAVLPKTDAKTYCTAATVTEPLRKSPLGWVSAVRRKGVPRQRMHAVTGLLRIRLEKG